MFKREETDVSFTYLKYLHLKGSLCGKAGYVTGRRKKTFPNPAGTKVVKENGKVEAPVVDMDPKEINIENKNQ